MGKFRNLFRAADQKKGPKTAGYDRNQKRPVIHASICNGEQVAGFKDLKTGKFEEVMFLRSEQDYQVFLQQYGIDPKEITKEY